MNCELAYTRRGVGEPVVLLHGIGHRRAAFDPVVDDLAAHYDVIAVDLPGLGDSPGLPRGTAYSADAVLDVLVENFAAWGVDRPHVVGNSLGGLLSIALAQAGHVRSATCLSPAGYFRPWSLLQATATLVPLKLGAYLPRRALDQVARTRLGRLAIGAVLYRHPSRCSADRVQGDVHAMRGGSGFWRYFLRCLPLGFRTPPILCGTARVPITIAWGDHDLILHRSQAALAARKLAGVEFVTLTDAGHIPMGDTPDQVVAAIRATTARAAGSASPASSVA